MPLTLDAALLGVCGGVATSRTPGIAHDDPVAVMLGTAPVMSVGLETTLPNWPCCVILGCVAMELVLLLRVGL